MRRVRKWVVYIGSGGKSGQGDWPVKATEWGEKIEQCLGQQERALFRAREEGWVRDRERKKVVLSL
jgi:hypothetical protein